MNRLEKLRELHQLYWRFSFGERFGRDHADFVKSHGLSEEFSKQIRLSECRLCHCSKLAKPVGGIYDFNCRLILITQYALWDEEGRFHPIRSAKILSDIAKNIFEGVSASFLSLVKCSDQNAQKSDFHTCMVHLKNEIASTKARVMVCFGGAESLEFFGVKDSMLFGKILEYEGRALIITNTLKDLVKNPSLKLETHKHLLVAKGLL